MRIEGRSFPLFFGILVTGLLVFVWAMSGCATADSHYIRNDLGFDAMRSPRVGIAVVAFAPGLQSEEAEQMLSGFSDALLENLWAQGYQPCLLLSTARDEGLRDGAGTRLFMGDKVFAAAREQGLAAVWVFRLVGFRAKPREIRDTAVFEGSVPVLTGGCWLDSYSTEGMLVGVRMTDAPGFEKTDTGAYLVFPPDEYGAGVASNVVRVHVKPFRGRAA